MMGFFFTTDPDEAKKKIEEIEAKAMSGLDPSRIDTAEEGWQMVEKIKQRIQKEAENKSWF